MKKLNNKGWSLSTMIMLLCGLIAFLLVIAFLVHKLVTIDKSPDEVIQQEVPTDEELTE